MRLTIERPIPVPENSEGLWNRLEDAKQLVHEPHIEADAVVLDDVNSLAVLEASLYFDDRVLNGSAVLDRVVEQIGEYPLHHTRIGMSLR